VCFALNENSGEFDLFKLPVFVAAKAGVHGARERASATTKALPGT